MKFHSKFWAAFGCQITSSWSSMEDNLEVIWQPKDAQDLLWNLIIILLEMSPILHTSLLQGAPHIETILRAGKKVLFSSLDCNKKQTNRNFEQTMIFLWPWTKFQWILIEMITIRIKFRSKSFNSYIFFYFRCNYKPQKVGIKVQFCRPYRSFSRKRILISKLSVQRKYHPL